MIAGRRILAIVPARGGSKGIPMKNLREVGGISLVALAGMIAAGLAEVDRAVVSTDNEEIAAAAAAAGLEASFRRPEGLSGDRIADWDVLHHALLEMERQDNVTYDIILMLQPTSPGRRTDDVRQTLQMLVAGGFDSVWTMSETDSKCHPLKQFECSANGSFGYHDPRGATIIARQQLGKLYHRNGVAYAITRDCLVNQRSIMGAKPGAVIIERPLANIDTEIDLLWADFLATRGELWGV